MRRKKALACFQQTPCKLSISETEIITFKRKSSYQIWLSLLALHIRRGDHHMRYGISLSTLHIKNGVHHVNVNLNRHYRHYQTSKRQFLKNPPLHSNRRSNKIGTNMRGWKKCRIDETKYYISNTKH